MITAKELRYRSEGRTYTRSDLCEGLAEAAATIDQLTRELADIHKLVGRGEHADPMQNARCAVSGILSLHEQLRELTRELDEALRKVALFEPVVSAARDWARDVGDCHFCGYGGEVGEAHGEHCPMPDAQRALEEAEEKRNE